MRKWPFLVPLFWALLPELGTLLVDYIGPRYAIALIFGCAGAATGVVLAAVVGVILYRKETHDHFRNDR